MEETDNLEEREPVEIEEEDAPAEGEPIPVSQLGKDDLEEDLEDEDEDEDEDEFYPPEVLEDNM